MAPDIGAGAGLHQAGLVGEHDDLGTVAEAELGQDRRDVGLHRRLGDEELGGDLGIAHAPGHEA